MVSFVLWLLYFCSLRYCLRAILDSVAKRRLLKYLQEYYCLISCDMQSHRYLPVFHRKPICSPPSAFMMGGTSEMSANLYQTTWWYILQTTAFKVITNRTSHIYSTWTPKIYSIANCYTDCTTQNGFPILSQLHSTGIYSKVFTIKNDLIYNILPLCQYWSWQSTCPGLLSMVWIHPVCKPACQLVQDCPIQFDLLQHLMSDHGYLSVWEYEQTNTKMFHWISYIQHKDCDMKDTEYFLVICHLI